MTTNYLRPALILAAGLLAPGANAAVYNFVQTGFDDGATISGSFTVNDTDNSGQINVGSASFGMNYNEISALSLSFSGNSIVAAFTHNLADLSAMVYNVGSPYLDDEISGAQQELIATNYFGSTGFDYYSGMGFGGFGGAVFDKAGNATSYSYNLVSVTPAAVPVPGAVWLFGSVLAGFVGVKRRKA
ncbi:MULTISPECIES: VPLPA-CTERM sorting domain-containing protein [Methylomonas]|uniref:PEP-CTERM domain protein n=2 Tax=Methylomonas TaxID=416 RepID=A0A140E437_9GAMM|nr:MULTISPECIES: VPLPA-CTERM sorting domain-containing protein [Methylomonas]AMK75161.1 hypothetical protein JT25_001455 [Methylomonas denitrificans]OAH99439.1 hypothetical protein A1342_04760 [Methylomonas methanica]TCV85092.1 putative secreted protein with PEP-CTERM sorting signal [Methylomonas methanica]